MGLQDGRANAAMSPGLIFVVFVFSRALHPMIIDWSKHDGALDYSKNSPAVMSQVLSLVFVNCVAFKDEGMEGVRKCWKFQGASIFLIIGLWYAFGDFLEMCSMGSMKGGLYQLLLQSKLLITAIMLRYFKGTEQTELQWQVLVALTLSISAFVMVDSDSSSDGNHELPMMGIVMVLFKVAVSCYAAVLSDTKLKSFSDMSMSAKLSQMSLARVIASLVIATAMEPGIEPSLHLDAKPFFYHWDLATWAVTVSFCSKSLITLYLLKVLDGIQKNVGEALAVIVIFVGQIAGGSSVFDQCSCLLSLVVVILIRIYGLAGKATCAPAQDMMKFQRLVS